LSVLVIVTICEGDVGGNTMWRVLDGKRLSVLYITLII